MMQQSVLLAAIRGPDGLPKYNDVKMLLRWYRRCILLSAIDQQVLETPYDQNGGSFTGPSFVCPQRWERNPDIKFHWQPHMDVLVNGYVQSLDAFPHHFQLHFMHAIEILGYKHPVATIREWWRSIYLRLVNDMHLRPETEEELDRRLGDSREGWLEHADPATTT